MTRLLSRRTLWLFLTCILTMVVLFPLITQGIFARFEGRELAFHQALLFVMETLTTVGYGELLPFRSWVTTIWSLLLMAAGFVLIFVVLAALVGNWLSARFYPRPPRKISRKLSGHVIICGAGPAGQFLAHECRQAKVLYVLLDDQRSLLQDLMETGLNVMEGDVHEAKTLQQAGIATSRTLAVTPNDPDNASVCLMARALRADLPLYCTVEHAENEPFLLAAGASKVVSAQQGLGERLGWLSTAPLAGQLDRLTNQVDGLSFFQVPILPGSPLAAPTLRQARIRERTGATILGIWSYGHFVPALDPDLPLRAGDVLIAAGRQAEIDSLRDLGRIQVRALFPAGETVLVLGAGDVGLAAIEVLEQKGIPFRGLTLKPPEEGGSWIQGDATNSDDLEAAGITQVGRCIVALDDDSRAVFATSMARQLNPAMRIVARANELETVSRLYLAGADNVLSVSEVAGTQLARLVMPSDLLPPALDELEVREIAVPAGLVGRSLAEARVGRLSGCIVLAVHTPDGGAEVNPSPRRQLAREERLVLFGTAVQFDRFTAAYDR